VLGEAGELRVWSCGGQDLCVMSRDHPPPFAFERSRHYGGAAALGAALDDRVNKLNEFIGEADRDLFAHTIMVPLWDQRSTWSLRATRCQHGTGGAFRGASAQANDWPLPTGVTVRPFRIRSRTAERESPSSMAGQAT
jgi:hypothetical protein